MKIHVSEDGKLGWATCLWDLTAKMGEPPLSLPVRCTWVLEKRKGEWVIVHFHKSVAMK
jgi:ketosteroid isomerase-like protein